MPFVADLHLHSRYSLATSKECTLEHFRDHARLKGIDLLGSGDCLHPGWLSELQSSLAMSDDGFYRLVEEDRNPIVSSVARPVGFLPTTEICSVFRRNGRGHKIHCLLLFPDFEVVRSALPLFGDTASLAKDGRPILGSDIKDLFGQLLDLDRGIILIPAHILTPWSSLFGSRSGFDSIEECFGDLSAHIHTLETGLSSDPAMIAQVGSLNRFTLVSFSDAHSPKNLGREATVFPGRPDRQTLFATLSGVGSNIETYEYFPQEGKYHYDGHRRCSVRLSPEQTMEQGSHCPVCKKKLTLGVAYRIAQLSVFSVVPAFDPKQKFRTSIPLIEIIAQVRNCSVTSKRAWAEYLRLCAELAPELAILFEIDLDTVAGCADERLARALEMVRKGSVTIEEGYDGSYGKVSIQS